MFYGQKAERIHRRTMGGGCHQVVVAVLLVVVMAAVTEGHGRVWEPPQRATMWRRGFDTTRDYNDNSLYCGGFKVSDFVFILLIIVAMTLTITLTLAREQSFTTRPYLFTT